MFSSNEFTVENLGFKVGYLKGSFGLFDQGNVFGAYGAFLMAGYGLFNLVPDFLEVGPEIS